MSLLSETNINGEKVLFQQSNTLEIGVILFIIALILIIIGIIYEKTKNSRKGD